MWARAKLEHLAASEDAIFQDPRWDRIYLAVERYEGTTQEPLIDRAEALRELDAALDAVSYEELNATRTGTLVDSIFDRIRDHKAKRDQERRRNAAPDQEPDIEPEQQP